ncbi:MAG: hypothetical protein JJU02_11795 [Cryomorphaceae bacterium]|nr:hypothetical protein [Cryomorphaceae bacterium]
MWYNKVKSKGFEGGLIDYRETIAPGMGTETPQYRSPYRDASGGGCEGRADPARC